jgi:hypothetical protein
MRSSAFFCLWLGVLLLVLPVQGQAHPEEINVQKRPSPEDIRARASNLQLQKDAKELAELCASIPADMDGVKQGLLPKDVVEKLKRVEKLSKKVRQELAP